MVKDVNTKTILDACCGSRMFWHNKNHPKAVYLDNRDFEDTLCDGRTLKVHPDIVADFRNMPFRNNSFNLVIFDPPHLIRAGDNSWLYKKYGRLDKNWQMSIKQGFDECMRVLRPDGTLIFKWAETQLTLKQVLDVIKSEPLIKHTKDKTHFLVFTK